VATRVGGIAEIADEPWDQLVAPDDPGALATALESAVRRPRLAAAPARSTSWSASADALMSILAPPAGAVSPSAAHPRAAR
jgi:glycosyltransferase involved in cell wall biosynthesis